MIILPSLVARLSRLFLSLLVLVSFMVWNPARVQGASSGPVSAWGDNTDGELGHVPGADGDTAWYGSTYFNTTPMQIASPTTLTAIAANGSVLAVKSDGTVWAWGANVDGEIGHAPKTDGDSPSTAYPWDYNQTPMQVSGLTNVTAVAIGTNFSLALKSDGTVWAWGDNDYDQLGHATNTGGDTNGTLEGGDANYYNPTPSQVAGLTNVSAISAGGIFALALKKDGTVWAWGDNSNSGELGPGGTGLTESPTPIQITGLANIIAIAGDVGGNDTALALKSDGTVWAWGDNGEGQLGHMWGTDGDLGGSIYWHNPTPTQVVGIANVTAISAGSNFALALKSDGTVWGWGEDSLGELGSGHATNAADPTPTQVVGIANVISIAGGVDFSMALKNDGTVWVWGNNSNGELGESPNLEASATPTQIVGLAHVSALAAGNTFCMALAASTNKNTFFWQNTQTGDLNDWIVQNSGSGPMLSTSSTIESAIPLVWKLTATADLTHNGTPGLLWQNTQTGDLSFWVMNGLVPDFVHSLTIAKGIPVAWQIVGTSDILQVGTPGIFWQNTSTGEIDFWQMNGTTLTKSFQIDPPGNIPLSWKAVGIADFTHVGEAGILWQNTTSGEVGFWKVSGGTYVYVQIEPPGFVPSVWKIVGTADLDGDGTPDIVWRNSSTGDMNWWKMNGTTPDLAHSGTIASKVPLVWRFSAAY